MGILITNTLPSISLAIGTAYSFIITAVGTPPLQYEWYKNGLSISGEITDTLTFTSLQTSDAGSYYVRVYNMSDSSDSNTATLEIQTVPVITQQPQNVIAAVGDTISFQVLATGNALQYEWMLNGVIIPGGPNSFQIVINTVSYSDIGTYSVRVFNSAGSVVSAGAMLSIPPIITTQPTSIKQQIGTNGVFSVISSNPFDQYQWYKNGVPVVNGIFNTLQFIPLTYSDIGSYYVNVYNTGGYVLSNTVSVDVYDTPRVVVQPRAHYEVGRGGEIRICPQVYGGCFHFQWQKDGVDVPGENCECLTLSNAQYEQGGQYRLCATNPGGTVYTIYTLVYVNPVPQTCFPFETPAGGLAGGGNLASGLTDMKIGRAQECYIARVLPRAKGNNCCLTAGPHISPYVGGTTSAALLQQQLQAQALCNISTNIAVAKLKQYIQPCPDTMVDMRFVKYQRRGIPVESAPPPPGVFIPSNPAIPKATDGYCVPIIGITQSRF
jgi:hypothetical protein